MVIFKQGISMIKQYEYQPQIDVSSSFLNLHSKVEILLNLHF
jgi:hypothetical protein